ncbi:MAG: glycosyltransferase family 39 protein [Magnetococcales bacterium]|nr:glycosyltransferase family 39 protein [Magnetococcales bacterium]
MNEQHPDSQSPLSPQEKKAWEGPFPPGPHLFDWLSSALFIGLAVVILMTFMDYGLSWDEPEQVRYGKLILDFFSSGFSDRGAIEVWPNLSLRGGLFDTPVQFLASLSSWGDFGVRRLAIPLTGFVGIVGCWRMARLVGGAQAAFWAALFLILTPSYYGHMFINSSDIPYAAAMIWALYYLSRLLAALPHIPTHLSVKFGLTLGAALGVRIGGVLVIGYSGLLGLFYLGRWLQNRLPRREIIKRTRHLALHLLLSFTIAYLVMIAFWPKALLDPLRVPLETILFMSRFPWPGDVLFNGRFTPSGELPWNYLPLYFSIKLPECLLFFLGLAIPISWGRIQQARLTGSGEHILAFSLLWMAITIPLAYVLIARPVLYDGLRHFIFLMPPMAVLAGVAVTASLARLRKRSQRAGIWGVILLVIALASLTRVMVGLHPYQYVYFNTLVGGVQGASGRFERDYWATAYREAVIKMAEHAREEARVRGIDFENHTYRVTVCGPLISASHFLPENFISEPRLNHSDYFLGFTRWNCNRPGSGQIATAVTREGAILAVIKKIPQRALQDHVGSTTGDQSTITSLDHPPPPPAH